MLSASAQSARNVLELFAKLVHNVTSALSAGVMKCQGPNCLETKLAKAHIVPRGFARRLSQRGGHNRLLSSAGAEFAKQPLGDYDPTILCGGCDNVLGIHDDYAVRFCSGILASHGGQAGTIVEFADFDGDRFAKFVLALLWRASISNRPAWRDVALGQYETRARDVAFGAIDLSSLPEFSVVMGKYFSPHLDARRFYSMPVRFRSPRFNAYGFGLGGFQIIAKFDQRPFPQPFRALVINRAQTLRAYMVSLEETAEFAALAESVRAAKRQQAFR